MLNFPWLRPGSLGGAERSAWAKDKALIQSEGGSAASITTEKMKTAADFLRGGGCLVGLTTLCSLSTEFSYPGIRFQIDRVEMLARKKFTISKASGVVGGGAASFVTVAPAGLTAGSAGVTAAPAGSNAVLAGVSSGSSDDFYDHNLPHFPCNWPIIMPVVARDATAVPSKWQHAMGDELIMAFWKMVDFTQSAIVAMQGQADTHGTLNKYKLALQQARRLAQNIVITVSFAETETEALDRALSCRENLDDMAEFLGLSGWQRVLVIGQRRDALRTKGVPCSAADVTKALAKVEWAAGKEVTLAVVTKALTLYEKMLASTAAQDAVFEAQSAFGRQSPFEDWFKLLLILTVTRSASESAFVLWTIYFERVLGKRLDYSQDELKKKASPVHIICLRKRFIDGLISMALTSPIDRTCELTLRKPDLLPELEALKNLRKCFTTSQSYYQTGRAQDSSPCAWLQALPKWAAPLRKMLRAVYEGRHDKVLHGFMMSPPKGGLAAVTFEIMAAADDVKEEVNTIRAEMEEWVAAGEGRLHGVASSLAVVENVSVEVSGSGACPLLDTDEAVNARVELAAIARETRCQYVSLLVHQDTKDAAVVALQSAAKGVATSLPSTTACQRTCFLYSVGMSWDSRRPDLDKGSLDKGNAAQRRCRSRATALWKDDFTLFMQVASDLVTPESENYVVVFPGAGKRVGAGLASEAGLSTENGIFEIVRKVGGRQWHVKRIVVVYAATSRERLRGIAGTMQEPALFFFRGAWPSKLVKATQRTFVKGSTWDDVWLDARPVVYDDLPRVPYVAKQAIFKDAWSSMLKGDVPGDGADLADGLGDVAGDGDGIDLAVSTGEKRKSKADSSPPVEEASGQKGTKQDKKDKKNKSDEKNKKVKKTLKKASDEVSAKKKKKKKKKKSKKSGEKATAKSRKQDKLARLSMPDFGVSGDLKDCEPLVHNDLHITLIQQAIEEWSARCLVVWTLGCGTPLLAGVLSEVPAIGMALNDAHLLAVSHTVDSAIATRLQLQGNPLFDKDLAARVRRAIKGTADSGDEPDEGSKKQEAKEQKKKASRKSGSDVESKKDDSRKQKKKLHKSKPDKKKSVAAMLMGLTSKGSKEKSGKSNGSSRDNSGSSTSDGSEGKQSSGEKSDTSSS